MSSPPSPLRTPQGVHDRQRLAAVRRLTSLHRPPSGHFDRITRLAADLLDAPIGLLTLVDSDRQFFVSSYGLDEPLRSARQTPLDHSICQYVVASKQSLVVDDLSADAKLKDHPAVEELGVAAYAGSPVATREGHTVGATCVLDFVPRTWADDKVAILEDLAAIAADEIRLADLEWRAEFEQEWRGIERR
ncbi:MAG: GAF domain-containing protein [Acidimicrobiales bacterium]